MPITKYSYIVKDVTKLAETIRKAFRIAKTGRPGPVLIDVYRRTWLHGQFIDSEAHANLPGSHWLANTGDGELNADWAAYFQKHLHRLSAGDRQRPLVFYCRSDCWLSWNAVKRAARLGYTRLYWYRDGIDAWEAAGLPLSAATPEVFP